MFDEKLQKFLFYNDASRELFSRLNAAEVFTIEDAWNKASDEDLIWVVTRPGVMNPDQRRLFLIMILSSIEGQLTDPRSKNILTKLRTNEKITDDDKEAAARAAIDNANAAKKGMWASWVAARAWASWAASSFFVANISWAAIVSQVASNTSSSWDALDALDASAEIAACDASKTAARAAQAKWVRENFNLCNLRTN
jgi:hypothetical protein